jgi:flavin-dependent dehydrogenase
MLDILIAGAGPAGSIAALLLARAGARVLLVDRDTFPRDKLCGDTLNPGALRLLTALGIDGGPIDAGWPLDGMILTGPSARVEARYADGQRGRAVTRRVLDQWLLEAAIKAGARFEGGWVARGPLVDPGSGGLVRGLVLAHRGTGRETRMPAILTIAADGRQSAVARALGLRGEPPVRRWAFGAYATGVQGVSSFGEMHIRPGSYLGIAPVSAECCNVCLVMPPRPAGRTPLEVLGEGIARDPDLTRRFARARFVSPVRVLGPLAASVPMPGAPGLLLAGDAAGFVDPMTGDGLHLAMQGAMLAADEAARVIVDGSFAAAPWRLAAARRARMGGKLRFNRWVCRLVESPVALGAASQGARLFPGLVRRAVAYAGDLADRPRQL